MRANTNEPGKPPCISKEELIFCGSEDNLKNDIWPRSLPLWTAAVYMAFFIIRPWEELIPFLGEIHFERLLAVFMLAVVFFSSKKQFKTNFQNLSILLFAGALGFSFLLAWNPLLAWDPFYQYLTLVTFYFVLIFVIRTPYDLVFMLTCYIAIMGIYLGKSQWEYFVNDAGRFDMGVNRMWGIETTYGYPNAVAQSIVLSLPILVFIWSVRKAFSCRWPIFWRKWLSRFLLFYFGLAGSSIMLTNSRTGMLLGAFFFILVSIRGKRMAHKFGYMLLIVLILGIFWQFMPQENKNRLSTVWDPSAGPEAATISAKGRIEGYKAGMTMFRQFPLTGVGVGNFKQYRILHVDGVGLSPHNLVGQLLGETGLLGATTFLLMVLVALVNCHRVRLMARSCFHPMGKFLSGMATACCDTLLLLFLYGLTGHNLLRFNWLWVAAFAVISFDLMKRYCEHE